MFLWQEMLLLILYYIVTILFDPIFMLVVLVIGWQFYNEQRRQTHMFGVSVGRIWPRLAFTILYGLIGGGVGSVFLVVAGVSINKLGLDYIWPVAILLMLVHTRFLCFAYAGGLIALASLLFGWPDVYVPQVTVLVAILHITESLLIYMSHRYNAVPVILRRSNGQMVGAFTLQNFWPLPLVVSAVTAVESTAGPGLMPMPDWWPLLDPGMVLPTGQEWLYTLLPIVAALGYADVAVATKPKIRRRQSAMYLAAYSTVLLVLSLLAQHALWLQFAAALFSPLGHELLIRFDNKHELEKAPRYVPPAAGLMVLDVLPDSPAEAAGLKSEDIIRSLGGMAVNNKQQLAEALCYSGCHFHMEIQRQDRQFFVNIDLAARQLLGIIPVPEGNEPYYTTMNEQPFFLLTWIKQKCKRQ